MPVFVPQIGQTPPEPLKTPVSVAVPTGPFCDRAFSAILGVVCNSLKKRWFVVLADFPDRIGFDPWSPAPGLTGGDDSRGSSAVERDQSALVSVDPVVSKI